MADKLKINIEPGLFEWLAWYQDEMPSWMTAAELTAAGYNVEPGYKPYISSEELHDTVQETCGQFFIRNFFITQCALQVRLVRYMFDFIYSFIFFDLSRVIWTHGSQSIIIIWCRRLRRLEVTCCWWDTRPPWTRAAGSWWAGSPGRSTSSCPS